MVFWAHFRYCLHSVLYILSEKDNLCLDKSIISYFATILSAIMVEILNHALILITILKYSTGIYSR